LLHLWDTTLTTMMTTRLTTTLATMAMAQRATTLKMMATTSMTIATA
jgi:hypothetical protein